jgi:voltage-gated potassium channel
MNTPQQFWSKLKPQLTKPKIESLLENRDKQFRVGLWFSRISILFNLFIISTAILLTASSVDAKLHTFFMVMQHLATIIFTFEYGLRIWASTANPTKSTTKEGIMAYLFHPNGLLDLITLIPFYIYIIAPFDYRLFALFRLLLFSKILRYWDTFQTLFNALAKKKEALLMVGLIELILLFFVASIMYFAENEAQPDKFPNLFTSMYWAGITLASVGYGDIVPITQLGKFLSTCMGFIGIAFFALPVSVIGAGFFEELEKRRNNLMNCPHCHEKVDIKAIRQKTLDQEDTDEEPVENTNDENPIPEPQNQKEKIQFRISYLLNSKYPTDWRPKLISGALLGLIALNAFALMIESNVDIAPLFGNSLFIFQVISVIIFTIEYGLRVWVTPFHEEKDYRDPIKGRLRYIISPMALIDLMAILPFYLPMIFPFDLRFIRILRLLRLFSVFKVGHFSDALLMIGQIFRERRSELITTFAIAIGLLIGTSTIMYYFERIAQPETFDSIPATMWWGIATLATIGYGDMVPVTSAGRFFAVICGFLGLGLFALPTGVLGAAFMESVRTSKKKLLCPHCGFNLQRMW